MTQDATYGYTEKNPIRTGGQHGSAQGEVLFLEALRGPEGQSIKYKRLGSCCMFKTPNAPFGTALLDKYEISYEGLATPVVLYFDMYGYDQPKVPVGFSKAR